MFHSTMLAMVVFGSILCSTETAFAQRSKMLLGIHCTQQRAPGLYVHSTIAGYSADGILRRGDVVLRTTNGDRIYSTNTHYEIEEAKLAIGSSVPASIEVRRVNRFGNAEVLYFDVLFQPIGGVHAAPPGAGKGDSAAKLKLGDRGLFNQAEKKGKKGSQPRGAQGSDPSAADRFRRAEEN
ncbi:MAG: hypothetical protein O3A00_17350 [Planctomycetota bacterium]|nr:hypothetical protein [Planctomycetota bacterium]